MLGIRLREHHELGVGRVPPEFAVAADEVVDFLVGQRQPEVGVGRDQRFASLLLQGNQAHRHRFVLGEQGLDAGDIGKCRLRHAIDQQVTQRQGIGIARLARETDAIADAAFDPVDGIDVAGPDNVGRLGRPR